MSNWQEDFYSDPQMYTHTGSLELLEDGDGALKEQGEGLRDERQHGEKDTVHTGAKHAKSMAPRGKEKKRGSKGKSTLLGSWEEPRGGKKSRDSSSQSSDGKDNKGLPPAPPRPNKLKVVPASALSVIPAVRMTASASLLEAQECGEIMESIDEAAYALDGLRAHCPLRVQQTSAATLASLCAAPQHRRVLQGHGYVAMGSVVCALDKDAPTTRKGVTSSKLLKLMRRKSCLLMLIVAIAVLLLLLLLLPFLVQAAGHHCGLHLAVAAWEGLLARSLRCSHLPFPVCGGTPRVHPVQQ